MGWLYVVLFWVKSTYLSHNISHYNYNDLFLVVGIGFYYCAICKNKYIGSSNLLPRSFVTRDVGTRLRLQIQKFFQFFHNSGTKCFNRKQPFQNFPCCLPFTLSVVCKRSTFKFARNTAHSTGSAHSRSLHCACDDPDISLRNLFFSFHKDR